MSLYDQIDAKSALRRHVAHYADRVLTPVEALQLADELRELATEAATYAAEAKA